ncbi:MAG TPA: hypothetical protein VIT00_05960 [Terrimicrobiaceae bacterium]
MRFIASIGFTAIAALVLDFRVQAQPLPATTNVQIVNATSVPVIVLKLNDEVAYEAFPQGKRSADAPVRMLEAVYEAENKQTGSHAKSGRINYEPGAHQSLVILGDFSTDTPPGELKQPGEALTAEERSYAPNILFQVYSHTTTNAPVRLRVINGMPGKSLTFLTGNKAFVVKPGGHAVLENQPPTAQYSAKVDAESIPLLMRQEGLIRNAMIVFYLKEGKPAFMRAFENNADSHKRRLELEKVRQ